MNLNDILKYIPSIRRPVSLAALIVVVLYGIYKLILSLPIFEGIGGERTFQLIDKIVFYLFVVALISVVLSISKPVFLAWVTKPKTEIAPLNNIANQEQPKITTTSNAELNLEEYIFLLDTIVDAIYHLEFFGNTFGDMRRTLKVIIMLTQKASAYLLEILNGNKIINENKLSNFVNETLPSFISEASIVLPYSDEDKYTRDREVLKKLEYQVISTWNDDIKKQLLQDSALKSKLGKLTIDEKRKWSILGFENSDAYQEYIYPSFSTLCKSATPIQKKLLEAIKNVKQITMQELIDLGFPKVVIIETLNPLLRSKLMTTDDFNIFSITPVGKEMVSDYLSQP